MHGQLLRLRSHQVLLITHSRNAHILQHPEKSRRCHPWPSAPGTQTFTRMHKQKVQQEGLDHEYQCVNAPCDVSAFLTTFTRSKSCDALVDNLECQDSFIRIGRAAAIKMWAVGASTDESHKRRKGVARIRDGMSQNGHGGSYWGSCSTSLTPSLSSFHFSHCGFMMCCKE